MRHSGKKQTSKGRLSKPRLPAVRPSRAVPQRASAPPPRRSPAAPFPVVGIGASAGGLEAFTQLLTLLPPDTGMGFVFIQHLSPTHTSFLSEALASSTQMPVTQAEDGMRVEPNHVYVLPPGEDMEIADSVLRLHTRVDEVHKPHLPVDLFLRSLAAAYGSRAIGVILSGTASDGTHGLRAIKEESGITLVQEPQTAKFGGMPQSAVQAGVVDFCLPVPQLVEELVRLGHHCFTTRAEQERSGQGHEGKLLERLFALVRGSVGVDFSEYKSATFERRLAHRMALRHMQSLADYVKFLEQTPGEAQALHEEVLIHVTSFFRDPEAFEALKQHVFPALLEHKAEGAPLRLWAAGCSTGEEVYSLAICLLEALGGVRSLRPIQIFGSDISAQAIEKARAGLYPESALRELSHERKARFFTQVEGGSYRIAKAVRELCVFVRHDLARDPPFSRLDLVTCRNVLIYFTPELQKRVLATFHYCLNEPGFLLLGRTESLTGFSQLFKPVNKVQKLAARVPGPSRLRFSPGTELAPVPVPVRGHAATEHARPPPDETRRIDRLLLSRYAPPGIVVNDKLEITQFRGHTGAYLEHPPGEPQLNVFKMAREGLLSPLRLALSQARKKNAPCRIDGVQVGQNGSTRLCDIVVLPVARLPGENERLYLVLFEEVKLRRQKAAGPVKKKKETPRVSSLKLELEATQDYLQSLIEEHGRTTEALASANEELVSGNEELQSLNEELETAKEELQSTNEELTTVNDELHSRNQELHLTNGDLVNLLNTVDTPVLILDLERRIRRFTPRARSLMNVLPSDVGRPLRDITLNISVTDLDSQLIEVIETATMRELEVQDRAGHWYRMHLRPYKTTENRIDGAILSLVDIDALKHHVSQVEWARDYATGIVEAVQVPLMVLDAELRVLSANKAFYQAYSASASETVASSLFALCGGAWDVPELRGSLGQMLARNTQLQGLELEHVFPQEGKRRMSLSARSVHSRTGVPMILLVIEDITERAQLLARAQQAQEEAERANRAKDQFLATLSHELRTPLSTMLMQAQLLRRGTMDEARIKRAGEAIERSTKVQAQLINDLLDVSRIVTGKLMLQLQPLQLPEVIHAALESVSAQAERKAIRFELTLNELPGPVSGDPTRLQQVVWNLLSNAIKFSPEGQRVRVVLEPVAGHARLRVSDVGAGIEAEFLPRIFDRFMQEDSSTTRVFGGLGLGLAIVRNLVELHGGSVQAQSPGKGLGATFTVILPLMSTREVKANLASPVVLEHPGPLALPRSAEASSRLRGLRVLVVDDDPGTRDAATELLRLAGAEARQAESAETALGLVEDFRPEVLLSDIAMPGQDGYTFIRRVRALGPKRGGDVPAIALTALVSEADRREAFQAGFQRHLAKPIDIDRLMAVVEEAWAGKAPPEAMP